MIEVFITVILLVFFGLFLVLSFPMKDEVKKLNKQNQAKHGTQQSTLHDS